jgi:hypothetical protein
MPHAPCPARATGWLLLALVACGGAPDPGSSHSSGDPAVIDADGDGYGADTDCDDQDGSVNPSAPEVCDGLDNDCDDLIDDADDSVDASSGASGFTDADRDGFGDPEAPIQACALPADAVTDATDCDDTDPEIHPDATERCDPDDRDEDCDGQADDADPSVDPGSVTAWYRDADSDGHGDPDDPGVRSCDPPADGRAYATTAEDCDDRDPTAHPDAEEICDGGVDNDCDGRVDADDDSLDPAAVPTWYPDADADGYGDPEGAGVRSCADPSTDADPRAADATDCDDGDARRNPGAAEVCSDGVDNDCDGDVNETCLDASDADFTFDGAAGDDVGYRVAIGDFNGDGTGDLVSSGISRAADDGTTYAGVAFVAEGPLSGALAASDATATLSAAAGRDFFGYALRAVDDLNGDGFDEVLVGAEGHPAGTFEGVALLFQGPLSGALSADDATAAFTGGSAGDYVGYTLAARLGDLSGDGDHDLVVGAWQADAGRAAVFLGPLDTDRSASDADAILTGETSGDGFGIWVDGGADLDGDGTADLLVGADAADTVYAFLGPVTTSGAAADADLTLTGDAGADFGGSLQTGDLDGDGAPDLLVGARFDATDGDRAGAWFVFSGPISATTSASAIATITGAVTRRQVGSPLHQDTVGDLDLDGLDDLVLSDRYDSDAASRAGAAAVFLGPVTGVHSVEAGDLRLTGAPVENGYFGIGTAMGDVDGDGLPDLLMGAPNVGDGGRVYGFFGAGL